MAVERSAGAVVFYRGKQSPEYLLLRHGEVGDRPLPESKQGYWNFPKGHIEKGEKSEATALREIWEEAGLTNVTIIPGFKETERYFYVLKGEKILKFVVWFLAQSKKKEVTLSFEHVDALWLSYGEALTKVTYPSSKKLLTKAHRFLTRRVFSL